ncbi:unnamed protein product [Cylicocyclus nassatus]|uniref:Uncharacterized protein n=1 Tax=Cylicocyclus nassatus TaxID=53992 RepID=A0AA36GID9_CYLNA|nr:unnamed protein product [Cylicocyclus nassatus]
MDDKNKGRSYTDVIVVETLKRKNILLELNDSRNPVANKKKEKGLEGSAGHRSGTMQEIDDGRAGNAGIEIAQWYTRIKCMSFLRYRQGTGGGLDLPLEQAIANASASFTEADMLIAQSLGKKAVMSGVGRMESFVDKGADSDSDSTLGGNRRRRRAGGRANLNDSEEDGGRERRETAENARFEGDSDSSQSTLRGIAKWRERRTASVSDSTVDSIKVASSQPLIGKDELKRIQQRRVIKQLQDFNSYSSSSDRVKRRRTSAKAVNELQLTVLKIRTTSNAYKEVHGSRHLHRRATTAATLLRVTHQRPPESNDTAPPSATRALHTTQIPARRG